MSTGGLRHLFRPILAARQEKGPATDIGDRAPVLSRDSAPRLLGYGHQDRTVGQEGALTSAHVLRHPSEKPRNTLLTLSLCPDRRPEQKSDPVVHVHLHRHPHAASNRTPFTSSSSPPIDSTYEPTHLRVSATPGERGPRPRSSHHETRRVADPLHGDQRKPWKGPEAGGGAAGRSQRPDSKSSQRAKRASEYVGPKAGPAMDLAVSATTPE